MIHIFLKNLFTDLYRQPLRTFLTLSGVIWGTFAVVLLLAFGSSVDKQSRKSMHGMGDDIVVAWPAATTIPYKGIVKGKQIRLTPDDIDLVKTKVHNIRRAAPEFRSNKHIRYKKEEFNNTVRGVNVDYQFIRNIIPQTGRFIDPIDMKQNRRVCFLGNTIAKNLFHDETPIGQTVLVEGTPFLVIGVMKDKIQTSNYSGQRDEHCVFIPYTTYSAIYGDKYVANFLLQPHHGLSKQVIADTRQFLGNKRGFAPHDMDALFIWDFTDFDKSMGMFFLAFNIFLGMIGSFTLLVGGVGVASIMLVVVEERVKEIGVKLAVGAKRGRILRQFFGEALTIVFLGGLIGFLMAAGLLKLIPVEMIRDYVGHPQINLTVGIATIAILLIVGSVSALMPAKRAASTDPIVALRS